jgi:hypothetical protein
MKEAIQEVETKEGICPLLNFACPRGDETADVCFGRVERGFDPIANYSHYEMLKCAYNRAKRFHEGTVKFWY